MPGMMEKGAELLGGKSRAAPNGTKSSSPSNGHYSEPESGGGDSGDEHDVGMRVGAEYQARIPDFEPGVHWCQMISYRKRIGPELLT